MTTGEQTAALLGWYADHARDLPWRGETDPYRIWVSEVMLQQTQVETVKPYYARWLERFPTLADLAAAELDDVLACWQGLGYYRRARGLHAGARAVVEQHGGRLPSDPAALKRLPGIGDDLAGAVGAIAFGIPAPAIDGNVLRVICRLAAIDGDPAKAEVRTAIRKRVTAMLPETDPGGFNQALMELGATVCTPTKPDCTGCPLSHGCRALARDAVPRYPHRPAKTPPRERLHVCAVIRGEAGWLVAQRPADGRWGGLWELPRVELPPDADPVEGLRDGLRDSLGVEVAPGERLGQIRHAVSGEKIELQAWSATLPGPPRPLRYQAVQWVTGFATLAMASAQRKLLAELGLA